VANLSRRLKPPTLALISWLKAVLGQPPPPLIPLVGDSGGRRYWRLPGCGLLVLYGSDPVENLAWLRIGRHLWFKGLPLPRLYDYDLQSGFFLLSDLGDRRLDREPRPLDYYPAAVEILARFHREGQVGFNPAWGHQSLIYNTALEASLEASCFLKLFVVGYLKLPAPLPSIWREVRFFSRLAVSDPSRNVLTHRDFQARNIMVTTAGPQMLDWQGAKLGPAAYDLASLLEDHFRPDIPLELKEKLMELYCKKASSGQIRPKEFRKELVLSGAARLMQALGLYGKLTMAGQSGYITLMRPALLRLLAGFSERPLSSLAGLKAMIAAAAARLETLN